MPHKPNPFVVALNQPPKGVHHGQHRRTSPPAHRDPSDGAGAGAGGTVAWSSIGNPQSFNPSWAAIGTFQKGSGAGLDSYFLWLIEDPKPPTLPYAGIRSGEIIGHRAWWVLPDGLCSLAHRFRWAPSATIEGKLEEAVWTDVFGMDVIWGGVYAFATCGEELTEECEGLRRALSYPLHQRTLVQTHPVNSAIGLVRGTVKLWGEVVEHKLGYRAQFAKLASIEQAWWMDGYRDEVVRIASIYDKAAPPHDSTPQV